jgi:parallel beta-helix repeat protein
VHAVSTRQAADSIKGRCTIRKLILAAVLALLAGTFTLEQSPASAATTHWVNDDDPNPPMVPPGNSCNNPGYATIQSAVNAAAPGDNIQVCPGLYQEQVVIPAGKNNLRLRSTKQWEAVIKAPPVMVPDTLPDAAFTIVRVAGAQNTSILAFTITGPGPGPCGTLHFGVRVDSGGSADILGNHITDIRDTPPPPAVSGCQNGVGVQVGRQFAATTGSAEIVGNVIERYQKNGMTIDNAGSYADIAHNRVLGVGPAPIIAQNGIQVSRGATASVRHNFVAQNLFAPQTVVSTGMLLFQAGSVVADHNTLTLNDVSVYAIATGGSSVHHNDIKASTFDGIAADGETNSQVAYNRTRENGGPGIGVYDTTTSAFDNNKVEDNADSGILLDNADDNGVGNNDVERNGTPDGDTTDGIRVESSSTDNTIHHNHLRDNITHDCHDDSAGGATAGTANFWIQNHGETANRPGICSAGGSGSSLSATTFGWNASFPWYDAFGDAAGYDWAAAYGTIDTLGLLQLGGFSGARDARTRLTIPSP